MNLILLVVTTVFSGKLFQIPRSLYVLCFSDYLNYENVCHSVRPMFRNDYNQLSTLNPAFD